MPRYVLRLIMQFLELRQRLGREIGLRPEDKAQSTILGELINDAAREVYEQTDLPNSLREQTIQVNWDNNSQIVTLPAHMMEIRGIRDYVMAITLHDMRPRYHNQPWPTGSMYTFRLVGESAICRSIENDTVLTMDAQVEDVTVTVSGATEAAAQISGDFDRLGAGTADTINWTEIHSVSKDLYTSADVVLKNSDDLEVARILNYLNSSRYIQLELLERPQTPLSPAVLQPGRTLDVLYKPYFRPLRLDTDVFQVAGFDSALVYKAVAIYRIRGIDETSTENKVLAAKAQNIRSDERVAEVIKSRTQGNEIQLQFGNPRGDISNLRGLRRYRYNRDDY
jgi:hypothetical protein